MPLIICPGCGNGVSSYATNCIHCGADLKSDGNQEGNSNRIGAEMNYNSNIAVQSYVTNQNTAVNKEKKNWLIPILIGIIVLIIASVCVVFGLKNYFSKGESGSSKNTYTSGNHKGVEVTTVASHTHTWKDATCTEPKKCSECGATEGEPLGHTTDMGKCSRCSEPIGADTFKSIVSLVESAEKDFNNSLEAISNANATSISSLKAVANANQEGFSSFKKKINQASEMCGTYSLLSEYKKQLKTSASDVPLTMNGDDVDSMNYYLNQLKQTAADIYQYQLTEISICKELGIEERNYEYSGNNNNSDLDDSFSSIDVNPKQWKISDIVTNTKENDYSTDESTIYSTDKVFFHFKVLEGDQNKRLKLYAKEYNTAVGYEKNSDYVFDGDYGVGDDVWYKSYCYDTYTGKALNYDAGIITVKIYDAETDNYLGGDTVVIR